MRTFSLLLFTVAGFGMLVEWNPVPLQQNSPPKVEIRKPLAQDQFEWNSLQKYEISVSDKEDGTTEYNEIAPAEVMLKIVYLPDGSKAATFVTNEIKRAEPNGLMQMKTLDCFNCHAYKSKLIGPSFESIAKKYPSFSTNTITTLTDKVIKGVNPKEGTAKMPSHPDLDIDQAKAMVQWILKNGSNPNTDYLPGIEGVFRTRTPPVKNKDKAAYVLIASYLDHGLKLTPAQRKEGKHAIILRPR